MIGNRKGDNVKVNPNIRLPFWKILFLKSHLKDTDYNLSSFIDSLIDDYLKKIDVNHDNYKDKI